jgi:hypothetical protein
VLGGDELEHLGLVAGPFKERGPQRIRDELGVSLQENAMPQCASEHGRRPEQRPNFLVAAGRDHDERRAGLHPFREGVVGGGIARVKGDQHIDAFDRGLGDGANLEAQARHAALAGDSVTQLDQFGSRLDATDRSVLDALALQPFAGGEGQVTLAAAHVHDGEFRVSNSAFQVGRQQMFQQLDEFVDLPELRLHSLQHLAVGSRDAEGVEPGRALWCEMDLLRPVVRSSGGRGVRRFALDEPGRAAFAALQLRRQPRGEEMGGVEAGSDHPGQQRQRLVVLVVFGDIARGMAPDERQPRAVAQLHRPHQKLFERTVRPARRAERQLHERAVTQRLAEQVEQFVFRRRHRGQGNEAAGESNQ